MERRRGEKKEKGVRVSYGISARDRDRKISVKDRVRKEVRRESRGVRRLLGKKTYWLREQIQLLKHHSCAAIRTQLPCLADHPRSGSPRHHQPSLCFYATLPFTDLISFSLPLHCCRHFLWVWWVCSKDLVIESEGCGVRLEKKKKGPSHIHVGVKSRIYIYICLLMCMRILTYYRLLAYLSSL